MAQITVREFLNAYSRLQFIEKAAFEGTHDNADWAEWNRAPVEYLRKRSTVVRERLWELAR